MAEDFTFEELEITFVVMVVVVVVVAVVVVLVVARAGQPASLALTKSNHGFTRSETDNRR